MEETTMTEQLTLIQKIAWIQNELKAPKDKKSGGGSFSFAYRNAEEILAKVKPLLLKHDLIITLDDELIEQNGRYFIKSTAMIIQSKDEAITSTAVAELLIATSMNASQASGATSSYARKYALGGLLGIDDGDDADDAKYTPTQKQTTYRKMENGSVEVTGSWTAEKMISDKQIKLINYKLDELKKSSINAFEIYKDWYKSLYGGKPVEKLSMSEAKQAIDRLMDEHVEPDFDGDNLAEFAGEIF